jgi:CheY-like chemotaxis protein
MVEITTSGSECLSRVDEFQPDIVLVQMFLKDMDAFDLLARCKSRTSASPVVVLFTSVNPCAAAEQMASLHIAATILKSSSIEQLHAQLQPIFENNLPPLNEPGSVIYITNRSALALRINQILVLLGLQGYWIKASHDAKSLIERVKPSVVLFEIEHCLGQIVSLMESAQAQNPQVNFVALSRLNDPRLRELMLQNGVLHLLVEPFDNDALSEAIQSAIQSANKPKSFDNSKNSVLVVEDSPDSAHIVEALLLAQGYSVTIAETAERAMDLLPRHPYNALLLALRLPGMSGVELLARIRHSGNRIPCVVVTRSRDQQDHRMLEDLGVKAVFSKPVDYARVTSAISELVSEA